MAPAGRISVARTRPVGPVRSPCQIRVGVASTAGGSWKRIGIIEVSALRPAYVAVRLAELCSWCANAWSGGDPEAVEREAGGGRRQQRRHHACPKPEQSAARAACEGEGDRIDAGQDRGIEA
ncbi:hypothetical protein WR25_01534 [Diploscapter pachys]|uniref:Uncharacterized protein n=1 Tax=Diploscapter pachys TaxID=2018661 RepID=A0A2A2M4S1_9BILA|nr:hypothetical protein WR25_01534 [Diploscapter pachys]